MQGFTKEWMRDVERRINYFNDAPVIISDSDNLRCPTMLSYRCGKCNVLGNIRTPLHAPIVPVQVKCPECGYKKPIVFLNIVDN